MTTTCVPTSSIAMKGFCPVSRSSMPTKTGFVLMAACFMAFAPSSPAGADSELRFDGQAQPLGGKACGPVADVTVYVHGRELTFVATPGPMLRGTVQSDGSFRLLPVPEATVYRRMAAPPVLEGRVASDVIAGDVKSRWCTYRFSARRT